MQPKEECNCSCHPIKRGEVIQYVHCSECKPKQEQSWDIPKLRELAKDIKHMTAEEQSWKEVSDRFDERFPTFNAIPVADGDQPFSGNANVTPARIKSFISQEISKAREEGREEGYTLSIQEELSDGRNTPDNNFWLGKLADARQQQRDEIIQYLEGRKWPKTWRHLVLDPLFWQALGKALGWPRAMFYCYECNDFISKPDQGPAKHLTEEVWLYHWHRFIDWIAEGKDVDEFFKQLLHRKE